jgi:DNA replication protein DnaC
MNAVHEIFGQSEFGRELHRRLTEYPPAFNCQHHGDYASTCEEGRALQFTCPSCAAANADVEKSWREDWRRHEAWLRSGIPFRYQNRSLDNWRPRTPALAKIAEAVQKWLGQLRQGDLPALVLSGDVGLGKTHIAAGIAKRAIEERLTARYVALPDLLSNLRASFDRESELRSEELMRPLHAADVLILDEIGIQRGTEWELDLLAQLVDQRYREDRALVICTNAAPTELPKYIGRRAADRLDEFGLTLLLTGESYRKHALEDDELRARLVFPEPPKKIELTGTYRGELSTKTVHMSDARGYL